MSVDYSRLPALHGSSVLVEPEDRPGPNAVAIRGTLLVKPDADDPTGHRVEIAVTYPDMSDMNGGRAHDERIRLTVQDVDELLLAEQQDTYADRTGAYIYVYPGGRGRRAAGSRPARE